MENREYKRKEEYFEKLHKLSVQAQAEGRDYVSVFLDEFLKQKSPDIELYHFIYTIADDFTEGMVSVYTHLLEKNMPIAWYILVSFVNDEKQAAEQYYPIILNCAEIGMDTEEIREILNESSTIADFKDIVEKRIEERKIMCEDEFSQSLAEEHKFLIEHLKSENEKLNTRIDSLLKESSESYQEAKRVMEESFSNKQLALEYKQELEQLRKYSSTSALTVKLAEGKAANYKAMAEQLEKKNSELQMINEQLESDGKALAHKLEQLEQINAELDEKVNLKEGQLEVIQKELEECRAAVKELEESHSFQTNLLLQEEDQDEAPMYDMGGIMDDIDAVMSKMEVFEEESEAGETDYAAEDLIVIGDNREEVVKHTNLFAMLISRHQEKIFRKKSQAEQESLIFIKMMEKSFSKELVKLVRNAMKSDSSFSRLELYKLIAKDATEDELVQFCGMMA